MAIKKGWKTIHLRSCMTVLLFFIILLIKNIFALKWNIKQTVFIFILVQLDFLCFWKKPLMLTKIVFI